MPRREPRKGTEAAGVIDLTGGDTPFRYAEIRTDAGVIRVNAGLVTTYKPHLSSVVIEIEVNTPYRRSGSGEGNWWVSQVKGLPSRSEVRITREGE